MTAPTRYRPTIDGLVDALVAWLPVVLVDLQQQAADGPARAPTVVGYALPPKRAEGEVRPPLVLVTPANGEYGDDSSTVTAILSVQSCSEDADGMRDDTNTIQRICNKLLELRTLGPFHLELPLRWVVYEDQPKPIWAGRITTTWTQPRTMWTGPTE